MNAELGHHEFVAQHRSRPTRVAMVYRITLAIPILLFALGVATLVALAGGSSASVLQSLVEVALPLVFVGLGQTVVILTGGIDLSVAGVMGLTSALIATQATNDSNLVLWMPLVLIIGTGIGALNGLLINVTRIQPFIVTLATWSILDGIALGVLPSEGGSVAPALTNVVSGSVAGIPKAAIFILVLMVVWTIAKRTRMITAIYAAGSNGAAAELNGGSVNRARIYAYAISGLAAALAGIYFSVVTQSGSPTAGDPFILLSVAAVVIGGTSLFGGRGGFTGTVLGALIIYLLPDIAFFAGAQSYYAGLFQGALLVLAIVLFATIETIVARRAA